MIDPELVVLGGRYRSVVCQHLSLFMPAAKSYSAPPNRTLENERTMIGEFGVITIKCVHDRSLPSPDQGSAALSRSTSRAVPR